MSHVIGADDVTALKGVGCRTIAPVILAVGILLFVWAFLGSVGFESQIAARQLDVPSPDGLSANDGTILIVIAAPSAAVREKGCVMTPRGACAVSWGAVAFAGPL